MNKFILIPREQYERFCEFQLSEQQNKGLLKSDQRGHETESNIKPNEVNLHLTSSDQKTLLPPTKSIIKPDEVNFHPTSSDQKTLPPPGLPIIIIKKNFGSCIQGLRYNLNQANSNCTFKLIHKNVKKGSYSLTFA